MAAQGMAAAKGMFVQLAADIKRAKAPKKKTGPISEGGTAALNKRKVTGGSFTKLKKLFGEM